MTSELSDPSYLLFSMLGSSSTLGFVLLHAYVVDTGLQWCLSESLQTLRQGRSIKHLGWSQFRFRYASGLRKAR